MRCRTNAQEAETMPTTKKRGSSKRETGESKNATVFAKRTAKGRFKDMDEKGRSQAAERRKAKKTLKSGRPTRGG